MTNTRQRVEFSDKTVERAIEAACKHFNTDKENLEIEVITKGSTGLFGLGGRPAKIAVAPKQPDIPDQTTDNEPVHDAENSREDDSDIKTEMTDTSPPAEASGEMTQDAEDDDESAQDEDESSEPVEGIRDSKPDSEEVEAFSERARHVTSDLLAMTGLDGTVEVKHGESGPYLDINGEDLSIIIGKDGNTLNAIEFLVNLVVKRNNQLNYRVMIEAQGYRAKRDQGLRILAEKTAEKVRKTGRSLSLQPMSARERRIVHIALREKRGIRTHSSGDGRFRKVVITPLRRRNSRRSRSKAGNDRRR